MSTIVNLSMKKFYDFEEKRKWIKISNGRKIVGRYVFVIYPKSRTSLIGIISQGCVHIHIDSINKAIKFSSSTYFQQLIELVEVFFVHLNFSNVYWLNQYSRDFVWEYKSNRDDDWDHRWIHWVIMFVVYHLVHVQ